MQMKTAHTQSDLQIVTFTNTRDAQRFATELLARGYRIAPGAFIAHGQLNLIRNLDPSRSHSPIEVHFRSHQPIPANNQLVTP